MAMASKRPTKEHATEHRSEQTGPVWTPETTVRYRDTHIHNLAASRSQRGCPHYGGIQPPPNLQYEGTLCASTTKCTGVADVSMVRSPEAELWDNTSHPNEYLSKDRRHAGYLMECHSSLEGGTIGGVDLWWLEWRKPAKS
ncbi:hypothetical protein JX265_006107 [Neoarthrinium moseri]|uniref:Uncharacterized protein n=1 Tax=Neoarthrinium moseri TaxID=1658444 RepID=A0A9P9WMY0_9PEZI|nr:hypothetical protein JX266_000568 [Neoarthrinium moseri]KAI1871067.1 hypothetical protein JX265_006107 [Neoarthrinium moseri]